MVHEEIGMPAMLEQTAEECCELAQGCLKMARYMRGENPTSKDYEAILDNIAEELVDMEICTEELRLGFYWERRSEFADILEKWDAVKREQVTARIKKIHSRMEAQNEAKTD
jgi:hypothetical protein